MIDMVKKEFNFIADKLALNMDCSKEIDETLQIIVLMASDNIVGQLNNTETENKIKNFMTYIVDIFNNTCGNFLGSRLEVGISRDIMGNISISFLSIKK